MKKSSNILRLAVGIALLFATSNYTYAQFGGLLNAAKKWVGKVDDYGNVYTFNDKMIRANSPIDKEVEVYVLFNMIATNEMLAEYKQKYDARVKEIQESRQAQLASAKANQRNEAAGGGIPVNPEGPGQNEAE